jgi:hypothetical protein
MEPLPFPTSVYRTIDAPQRMKLRVQPPPHHHHPLTPQFRVTRGDERVVVAEETISWQQKIAGVGDALRRRAQTPPPNAQADPPGAVLSTLVDEDEGVVALGRGRAVTTRAGDKETFLARIFYEALRFPSRHKHLNTTAFKTMCVVLRADADRREEGGGGGYDVLLCLIRIYANGVVQMTVRPRCCGMTLLAWHHPRRAQPDWGARKRQAV